MKSICFIGLDNYSVLNPNSGLKYIGGESVQQTLLAKAFVTLGYQVKMIVEDCGQPDGEIISGIEVIKAFRKRAGVRGVRYFYPRITSLSKAILRADADVYYWSCAGMEVGLIAVIARIRNKKFVYRVASDSDCERGKQLIKFWHDRKIFEFGLGHVSMIAAQSIRQVELLRSSYGLKSVAVNMVVEPLADSKEIMKDIDLIWVNNVRKLKRPEMFLQLACALPEFRFVMIGGPYPGMSEYYNEINQSAKTINNLELLGAIPYDDVNKYIERSKLFVNTSEMEGFPNSFLQAWVRGVPVVSFFDPDSLIKMHGLGMAPDGFGEMISGVKSLLDDKQRRSNVSLKARAFSADRYDPRKVAMKYVELLKKESS